MRAKVPRVARRTRGAPDLLEPLWLQRPLSGQQQGRVQRSVRPLPAAGDLRRREAAGGVGGAERCRDPGRRLRGDRRDRGSSDFVYFDPPYVPLSKTASFTAYAARQFGAPEQERLANLLALGKGAVPALLSNSYSRITREPLQRARRSPGPGAALDQLRRARSRSDRRDPGSELLLSVARGGSVISFKVGNRTGGPRGSEWCGPGCRGEPDASPAAKGRGRTTSSAF